MCSALWWLLKWKGIIYNFTTERIINIYWQSNLKIASPLVSTYKKAVCQRNVHQETTMAKSRTLNYYLYSMQINKTAQATACCRLFQCNDDKNANESDKTETAIKRYDEGHSSSDKDITETHTYEDSKADDQVMIKST